MNKIIKLKINLEELNKVSTIENANNYSLTHIVNALLEEYNNSKNLRKKISKIINKYDITDTNKEVYKNDLIK